MTVEGLTPGALKITPNHHYNGTFIEPWGERSQRGYGIEIIQKFFEEVEVVEIGGPGPQRDQRLQQMRALHYNDLGADRHTVAVVQALEAILAEYAAGRPGCLVEANAAEGGLVLRVPAKNDPKILYPGAV